jgi:hypothetical protein
MFPNGDPVAQDLAERLVIVAQTAAGAWLRDLLGTAAFRARPSATGLPSGAFWAAVTRGEDAGYVIPASKTAGYCRLRAVAGDDPAGLPGVQVHLIETRRHAIVRRGVSAFEVEEDGTVRLRQPR